MALWNPLALVSAEFNGIDNTPGSRIVGVIHALM
jgi:hypothetical protein